MKSVFLLLSAGSILTISVFAFSTKPTQHKTPDTETSKKQQAPSTAKPFVVLELFTSEGCSSCPSADAALREVANQEGVCAIGFHVTYWNRLGWKDPFSMSSNDERQYQYAEKFKQSGVYTPQLIVNGEDEFVGSKKNQLALSIQKALKQTPTANINLTSTLKDTYIRVKYQLEGEYQNKALKIAVVEKNITSKVLKGENEGRSLQHDNIVRVFQTTDIQATQSGETQITTNSSWNLKNCAVIAFIQDKQSLKILGASKAAIQ